MQWKELQRQLWWTSWSHTECLWSHAHTVRRLGSETRTSGSCGRMNAAEDKHTWIWQSEWDTVSGEFIQWHHNDIMVKQHYWMVNLVPIHWPQLHLANGLWSQLLLLGRSASMWKKNKTKQTCTLQYTTVYYSIVWYTVYNRDNHKHIHGPWWVCPWPSPAAQCLQWLWRRQHPPSGFSPHAHSGSPGTTGDSATSACQYCQLVKSQLLFTFKIRTSKPLDDKIIPESSGQLVFCSSAVDPVS